jgi:hypothetical protein
VEIYLHVVKKTARLLSLQSKNLRAYCFEILETAQTEKISVFTEEKNVNG